MISSSLQQLKAAKERIVSQGRRLRLRQSDLRGKIEKLEKHPGCGSLQRAMVDSILLIRMWFNDSRFMLSLLVLTCVAASLLLGLVTSDLLDVAREYGAFAGITFGITTGTAIAFFPTSHWLQSRATREKKLQKRLKADIKTAKKDIESCEIELLDLSREIRTVRQRISEIEGRFETWEQEVAVKNLAILQEDWRSLKGIPFETWLSRIFSNLGGKVELTKASGDQGVDLIVHFPHGKVAIQAKGYPSTVVGNKAVQEIYAGAGHYRIDDYAVVTNSTFTKSAKELAASLNCALVDKEGIENLAFGKIPGLRERNP